MKSIQNRYNLTLKRKIALECARYIMKEPRKEHPLRQLFWESTLRCNVHCRHCGSDCKQLAGVKDMPREDFFRVLDSVSRKVDPSEVFVIVSGGEPLMRDDIVECAKGINERGFRWGMVTNGLYLTQDILDALLANGLRSLSVSLDGMKDDHNWLRGHKDSFDKTDKALDLLVEAEKHHNFIFDAVSCIHQRNYGSLSAICEYIIGKGLHRWRLYTIFPVGRAAKEPLFQLSNEQFRGLLDFIKATRKEGKIHAAFGCEGFMGNYEGDIRDHFFNCSAGITVGSVMADGAIAACASIRADYNQGNIYEDDFMDVWENRYHPHRDRSWMKTGDCKDCKHFRYCQGNAMHLRDQDGNLLICHLKRIAEP